MNEPELFDPRTAPEAQLRAVHELYVATEAEAIPDDPPMPLGERIGYWRHRPEFEKIIRWAVWDGGNAVGTALFFVEYLESNQDHATFWIQVREDLRRRGLGTELLRPVLENARAENRTMLNSWTWEGSPGEDFLAGLGAENRSRERISRLWVKDVDLDQMRGWIARAPERASDYELVFWEGPSPDDLLEPYTELTRVMNTAPRDDLEMEDWILTAAQTREWEQANTERGTEWWTMCARHQPTGRLAGYTQLLFSPYRDYKAGQADTGVDPEHRNKGLGRWLKAAMFMKLVEERPEVDRIDTGNAGSNKPMLTINVEMGYRPLIHEGSWQVPIGTAAAAIESRR